MSHKIAVSIINFRTADLTIQAVQSVRDDLTGIDAEIIVVDNLSGDGSAERIEDWITQQNDPRLSLVLSDKNTGFSGGHNQGFAASDAEFLLVLNSDAIVRPGFFKALLETAETNPKAGLIAPRLEGEDGVAQTSCFRFHTPQSELIRSAKTGFISRLLRRYDVPLAPEPDPSQIEWASFACILLRTEMIRDIGPMDEGYFLYFEDSEYCLRARRAGWHIAYAPNAVAVHFRGGSGPVKALAKAGKRLPRYFYSSRSRFFYQAHGKIGLWSANLCWYVGRALAGLRALVGKPTPPMVEQEYRDIWINAFNPLGPRRAPGDSE